MATILRMAAGLLFFIGMVTCVLWAVVINLDRVDQVNKRLPPEEQIGYWLGFIGPERNPRFEKEYVRLFPDRRLRTKERMFWLLAAIALIGCALCMAPVL